MVLARVNLLLQPGHHGSVRSRDHEKILRVEAEALVLVDDLDVGQPLAIGADLILTLDDQHPFAPQNAPGLTTGLEVQVGDGRVPLRTADGGLAV